MLFFSKLEYGVLMPSDPSCPHVLQAGAVVPLQPLEDPGLDRAKLKKIATCILVIVLVVAILDAWHTRRQGKLTNGELFSFNRNKNIQVVDSGTSISSVQGLV